jgi:hypothetical protein
MDEQARAYAGPRMSIPGDTDMKRGDFLALVKAMRPEYRMQMDADTAEAMGAAIGRSIPAQAAPVVNVPAPVVNVAPAQVTVAPAAVHVAAVPAPAVVVNVDPTPVTVENNVNVEQRPFVATPQKDGTVVLAPKA